LVIESTESVSQDEFACFVRETAGDSSHHELLNGRVVMNQHELPHAGLLAERL
jgi:hypothetical protein